MRKIDEGGHCFFFVIQSAQKGNQFLIIMAIKLFGKNNIIDDIMEILFISVFNNGVVELAINHLTSLKKVGINNYCAFCLDMECYNKIKSLGFTCEFIKGGEYKEFKEFGSKEFNKLSFMRYPIISKILSQNKIVNQRFIT